ncbi:MAG: hypothetical protein CME62_02835 [Halobacteriovoraceae bacterium]|nr:hypothetical protein [Halobacteriovoraceae bacterium]|tara:strand:- start:18426 stop:19175 length:750 start_codon:yes stop_codon:yes gene_type:complete
MSQIGSNKLKKNYNDWAITSLLENAKSNEKSIMGWKVVAGQKVVVEVIFHIIRKFRKEIVVRAIGPQAKAQLADLSVGAENLNFYLPEDLVLFQSQVKKIDMNGDITISIPDMIAQVDRRKYLRLFVEEGIKASVSFQKENHGLKLGSQLFEKKCFDLSAGGLSFIISKSESKFFQLGDQISKLKVLLDKDEIYINCQVINIFEVEPSPSNGLNYKGLKVSLRYLDLSNQAQKKLDHFVFNYVQIEDAS